MSNLTGLSPLAQQFRENMTNVKYRAHSNAQKMSDAMAQANDALQRSEALTADIEREVAEMNAALGLYSNHPPTA